MKQILTIVTIFILAFLLFNYGSPNVALGQGASIWYPNSSNQATLVDDTWGLKVTSLVSCTSIATDGNGVFSCGAPGGGGGGGFPLYVQNGGATLNTGTTTLNFTSNSFSLTENPTDTFTIRVSTTTLGLLASSISDFVSTVRTSISETITGIGYDSGTGIFSLDSGYTIPTTTRANNWDTAFSWGNHASAGYDQVTTAGDGLTRTLNDFDCDTGSGSVFGCITAADWVTFNSKVSSTSIDTSNELLALLDDETGTAGSLVFSTNPLLQGFRSNASSTIGDGTGIGGLTILGNATTTGNAYFAGNVGIGTSTPSSRLNVYGNTENLVRITNSAATAGGDWNIAIGSGTNFAHGYLNITQGKPSSSNYELQFQGSGVVQARMAFSAPSFNSTITGRGAQSILAWTNDGGNFNGTLDVGQKYVNGNTNLNNWINGTGTLAVKRGSDSATLMTILSANGNIGIGTTTPAEKLVVSATGYDARVTVDGTGTLGTAFPGLEFKHNGSESVRALIRSDYDNPGANLTFFTSNGSPAEAMRIDKLGNVGIGSSSPSRRLTVSGDIYSTGNLTAASSTLGNATSTSLAITGISGSTQCLRVNSSGVVSGTGSDCASGADGMSNWSLVNGALTPTTTTATYGIRVNASSTIGGGTAVTGLTISGGATTTGNHLIMGSATSTTSFFSALGTFTNSVVNTLLTAAAATFTGLVDIGAGVLEIPNGTAPTVDSIGELAIDSTSNQLVLYGSEKKVIGNGNIYSSFTYATSTAWTGTTTIPLGTAYIAETWNGIQCFTDAGTLNVSIYDGTNRMNANAASTTVGTTAFTTNNTFTAGEKRYVDVGTPASSPTKISCTISKSITAD